MASGVAGRCLRALDEDRAAAAACGWSSCGGAGRSGACGGSQPPGSSGGSAIARLWQAGPLALLALVGGACCPWRSRRQPSTRGQTRLRRVEGSGARASCAPRRRGRPRRSRALFALHWPRAYRAAWLVVHDAAAAEDIAQEAFIAALGALDRFDRRRPFGPWLTRIVVNRAIDHARARRLRAVPTPGVAATARRRRRAGRASWSRALAAAAGRPARGGRHAPRARLHAGRDREGARAAARHRQLAPAARRSTAWGSCSMSVEDRLRQAVAPDEDGARERALAAAARGVARARTRDAPGRAPSAAPAALRGRLAAAAVAALIVLAAALSPPGEAVADWVRAAVGLRPRAADRPRSARRPAAVRRAAARLVGRRRPRSSRRTGSGGGSAPGPAASWSPHGQVRDRVEGAAARGARPPRATSAGRSPPPRPIARRVVAERLPHRLPLRRRPARRGRRRHRRPPARRRHVPPRRVAPRRARTCSPTCPARTSTWSTSTPAPGSRASTSPTSPARSPGRPTARACT